MAVGPTGVELASSVSLHAGRQPPGPAGSPVQLHLRACLFWRPGVGSDDTSRCGDGTGHVIPSLFSELHGSCQGALAHQMLLLQLVVPLSPTSLAQSTALCHSETRTTEH